MKNLFLLGILILWSSIIMSQETNNTKHYLQVKIHPETSEIFVTDSMVLSQDSPRIFSLHSAFSPISLTQGIKLKKSKKQNKATDVGMDRDDADKDSKLIVNTWNIKGDGNSIVISYSGKIAAEIEQSQENYQRGFSESPGIISSTGIYLAGSTYWVPQFEGQLMTFDLTTELPKSWRCVAQGERILETSAANKHIDEWLCDKPQEEVFLIGAEFNEYTYDMNSGIKAMAFLRTPDEGLANKYLEVTEQYMEMYQEMLGYYPYSKFALVENFWETGYGMPSFTLLGEKIIRFPFILHSSYPHELLHNWWGNSVYVDFESGNWCEGTTAFMADHLIKEQRGAGEEYRRSTLQKFSNFVNEENDFPLSAFIARHDGPSEAIGYGKALMFWQMLRRKIGDEDFLKGMQLFYKNNKYKTASYTDIRLAMEEVSNRDLSAFFHQWIHRTGAPEIAIKDIKSDRYANKYRLNISLIQVQKQEAFDIDIPISIITKNGVESYAFQMNKKEQDFQISLDEKPLKLAIDPQYDVFRILNPAEVPPTLSHIWASDQNIIVLPSEAGDENAAIYQKFAEQWKATDNDEFTIISDADIDELPEDKTAWVLGFENKFATSMNQELIAFQSGFDKDSVRFQKKMMIQTDNSFIFTLSKESHIEKQNIFISIGNENAIDGLIRKLPHYGKYSYLAFTGDEPSNIAKGQWPVINSPLVKTFSDEAQNLSVIEPREALATLKPVFSEKRMMASIQYLASEELKGRGLGTPELDEAAQYIAQEFEKAGLKAFGKDYYQDFVHQFTDKGKMNLRNVIGYIPGSDDHLKEEPIVVSAHYDHLGLGWPDVRKGNEGKIHYGADDNASGVAILLELARTMAKTTKPKRSMIFLACTGEEAGLIGSRYFVKHTKDYFSGNIFANVNIDTDGSLFDKKLMVLNANTAREWKFIFMGTDYTTGVKTEIITQELDASDQVAFIEKGIPAIQLFTGPTPTYHRPSDTYDKIDGKGLVKVATVSKEVLVYLADREDPMPYTGKNATAPSPTTKPKKSRRVSTGSVPDFAFQGKGVKISSVIPASAGEKAGLQAEDIILSVDGIKTDNLKEYSDVLKKYQPNDIIKLKVLRKGVEKSISLTLGER